MSTRGAVGWRIDGKDIALFKSHDSYPQGEGVQTLRFARRVKKNPTRFRLMLKAITVNDSYKNNSAWNWKMLLDISRFCKAGHSEYGMCNEIAFLSDSLFCEWAYIINFDDKLLEVYRGFNANQMARGRFAYRIKHQYSEYYGVKLVEAWSFDLLPTDKEFIRILGAYYETTC